MKKAGIFYILILFVFAVQSCNYVTHRTYQKSEVSEDEDPEPIYDIALDEDYENFTEFMFLGNRSENFSTYFNKFFTAKQNYNDGMKDYEQTFIANYNPSLDSLGSVPPASTTSKDKFNKVIETCSKIIQYNKNTRYFDDAVLLIGKSYYYQQDYLQAERKFSEFVSKLSKSKLYDEAILFLGRSKLRLRKISDGEKILNDLLAKTKDNEIKSDITEELANISLYRRDYKGAVDLLEQSVSYTGDKEKKSRKQYILAKIFLLNTPEKAAAEYDMVLKNTSDFDMTFYAKLNKYIALNKAGKYTETEKPLEDMTKKYRDYPYLRQLAVYELANTLFNQKKYPEALKKYYDVIIDYPGTKVASNSYYYIGYYYENILHDYLNALINYRKAATTTGLADFSEISKKKYNDFDRYFTLLAQIRDTVKIEIPEDNPELEKYRKLKLEEKGEEIKQTDNEPKIKGKGEGEKFIDTIKNPPKQEINPNVIQLPNDNGNVKPEPHDSVKTLPKDTSHFIKDTVINKDTVNHVLLDSLMKIRSEDSLKTVKQQQIYDGYFQMAELFLFNIEQPDSSVKYLDYLINNDTLSIRRAKALYMLANIYFDKPEQKNKANELFAEIIKKYPQTEIANEARKRLGITEITIEKDTSEVIYNSAVHILNNRDYQASLEEFKKIIFSYPTSSMYVKSLFAIGYIYENYIPIRDSAYKYYKLIVDKYSESEYALVVHPKVLTMMQFMTRDTTKKQDSTGVMDTLGIPEKVTVKEKSDSTISVPSDTVQSAPGNNVVPDTFKQEQPEENIQLNPPVEVPKQEKGDSAFLLIGRVHINFLRRIFYGVLYS